MRLLVLRLPVSARVCLPRTEHGAFSDARHAQIHTIRIAMMASIIGPFGGFFASGLKRAYGVKDFGNT